MPMLHKLLIFKHGIDFSWLGAQLYSQPYSLRKRVYTLFQEESIPTGIDSEIGNQILESSPKFIFVQKYPLCTVEVASPGLSTPGSCCENIFHLVDIFIIKITPWCCLQMFGFFAQSWFSTPRWSPISICLQKFAKNFHMGPGEVL